MRRSSGCPLIDAVPLARHRKLPLHGVLSNKRLLPQRGPVEDPEIWAVRQRRLLALRVHPQLEVSRLILRGGGRGRC